KEQLVSIEIAPTANTTFAQLHKVDGALRLIVPAACFYCFLTRIDLYQRAGAHPRVHGMVLKPDISENGIPQIDLLQQADGDFTPLVEHPGEQVGLLQPECIAQAKRGDHRLARLLVHRPDQMCPWQIQGHIPSIHVAQADSEVGQNVVVPELINAAQGVKLVDPWIELAIFYLGEPGMRYAAVPIVYFRCNLVA